MASSLATKLLGSKADEVSGSAKIKDTDFTLATMFMDIGDGDPYSELTEAFETSIGTGDFNPELLFRGYGEKKPDPTSAAASPLLQALFGGAVGGASPGIVAGGDAAAALCCVKGGSCGVAWIPRGGCTPAVCTLASSCPK